VGPITGKGQLTTEEFPFDLDTTSLALTVLKRSKEIAESVMDEMLEYVDPDGIIQVSRIALKKQIQEKTFSDEMF
jgi:hypothetical protein